MKFDCYDSFHSHHKKEPLRALWLVLQQIESVAQTQKTIMSRLTDLALAIDSNTQGVTNLGVSIDSAIAILQGGSANDSQLVALTVAANASAVALGAEKSKLDAAVTAAQNTNR